MAKRSALIIEDDPKLCVIYQTALRQAGFETDLDSTGSQFPDKLSSMQPDLVVLDIHLPYASGKDILEQIRSDERWAKVVVIVTTADLFLSKSLEKQADYVLIKPVSVGRLMKIVASCWPEDINAF
jgi:DNA-binding response OmpR family regulator